LLGFRGADLAVATAIFASPTATASFAMTQQMSGDDKLAAAVVVTSGGEEIARSRKPVLTPGEMVTIKLTPDKLALINGSVEFSIEEV